jgi:glycosyltransferase involved in cell wall biosynthesis
VNTDGPLKLLALGRADVTKGFDVLIKSVLAANQSTPKAVLLALCLSLPDAAARAFAAQLQILAGNSECIQFHFNQAGAELMARFAEAQILAVPSTWLETGPLVVLEAFSQGLPVLGSARGGIAELVTHGHNGWLVPAGDIPAWSAQILAIATERSVIENARNALSPVRTMQDVALEHQAFYTR